MRDRPRGAGTGLPAHDRREPGLGRRRGNRVGESARGVRPPVDRRADLAGRRPRPRHHPRAVAPIGVATGEHCHNRVMFKQLLQAEALDYCQVDTGRLASVNEILTVLLMAAKFGVPVCPHAGGVGLCEMVQHISVLDFVAVSGELEGRVTEYVDHLHEHFTDPCLVADRGAGAGYVLPTAPGYSTRMHASSVAEFSYPDGAYWRAAIAD